MVRLTMLWRVSFWCEVTITNNLALTVWIEKEWIRKMEDRFSLNWEKEGFLHFWRWRQGKWVPLMNVLVYSLTSVLPVYNITFIIMHGFGPCVYSIIFASSRRCSPDAVATYVLKFAIPSLFNNNWTQARVNRSEYGPSAWSVWACMANEVR